MHVIPENLGRLVTASILVGGLGLGIAGVTWSAAGGGPQGKVTICHRTNSASNPYNQITVNTSAVDGRGNGNHYVEHVGPVWRPSLPAGTKWGDIIPPIVDVHDGLNWGKRGQRLWRAGCAPATPVPRPTGSSSPTGSPSSSPSPTRSPSSSTSPTSSPSASPTGTPTPTPTAPDKPLTPIVVVPGDGGGTLEPGGWEKIIDQIRSPGAVTIDVSCTVNGVERKRFCRKAVGVRRAKVKVPCANVVVRVTITAARDGMRTHRWSGRWTADTRSTICRAKANG